MKLEQTILKNLIYNDEYTRKVLPFLRPEYFSDGTDRKVFHAVNEFVQTYNSTPTVEAIELAIQERRNLTNEELEKSKAYLEEVTKSPREGSGLWQPKDWAGQ